jgi:hypothetical protein
MQVRSRGGRASQVQVGCDWQCGTGSSDLFLKHRRTTRDANGRHSREGVVWRWLCAGEP